jgi:hypothetical protein
MRRLAAAAALLALAGCAATPSDWWVLEDSSHRSEADRILDKPEGLALDATYATSSADRDVLEGRYFPAVPAQGKLRLHWESAQPFAIGLEVSLAGAPTQVLACAAGPVNGTQETRLGFRASVATFPGGCEMVLFPERAFDGEPSLRWRGSHTGASPTAPGPFELRVQVRPEV